MSWTYTSVALPPEGRYVLVHVTRKNWFDRTDQRGVMFKVAKLQRGISLADREKMKTGALPDPAERVEIQPGIFHEIRRSDRHRPADEGGNNERAYCWHEFGPDLFEGQDVDWWCEIPPMWGK